MRNHNQYQQITKDDVIGLFRITGESPKRNTRGSLAWQCECVAASHPIQIEHAVLAYGATPTQCDQCLAAEVAARAAIKADEKRIERELSEILQEQRRKEAQQAAQIAQPDKTRVLVIPVPEVTEGAEV